MLTYIEDIHYAVLHSLAIGRAGEPTYLIVFFGDSITKRALGHKFRAPNTDGDAIFFLSASLLGIPLVTEVLFLHSFPKEMDIRMG